MFFQQSLRTGQQKYQNLNHPNVLKVYIWNPEYMITERAEIWDIDSMTDSERLDYKDQLLSLFSFTQKNKIIHGSLHPEFLFVRPNKTVAVTGWDFSQRSLPMINTHRAPENFRKNGGMSSDLYAVVLLTYELLTKKKPWEAKCTVYEVQKRKCESLLRPMTAFAFPEQKSNLFMKALNIRPSQRYKSILEFKNSLTGSDVLQNKSQSVPQIRTVPKIHHKINLGSNQQNTSLALFLVVLGIFLSLYKPNAQAGGAQWKTGYTGRDGTEYMEMNRLDIEMVTLGANTFQNQDQLPIKIKSFSISQTEITQRQ